MLAISRALMSRRPRLLMLDDPSLSRLPELLATSGFASVILEGDPGCGTDFFAMASIRGLIERAADRTRLQNRDDCHS